jgi:hypothetical protein
MHSPVLRAPQARGPQRGREGAAVLCAWGERGGGWERELRDATPEVASRPPQWAVPLCARSTRHAGARPSSTR